MNILPPDKPAANQDDAIETALQIPIIAGYRPDGEAIVEKVTVTEVQEPDSAAHNTSTSKQYRLLASPAFVRGLASGDRIRFPSDNKQGYELVKRSGNLCIKVMRKDSIDVVLQTLTPEMELLDGVLDVETPRLLVYSIHVSIGFQAIEQLLDRISGQFMGTLWVYGNVYDPKDGVSPLDWWQEFLAPV
ncbi:MAG: DUF4265 domain-containing protein [Gammaproteobacteria bacterium]